MTQEEILDYNRRCAEFLGKDKKEPDVTWTFPAYLNGYLWVDEHFFDNTDEYCGRRPTKVSELKFHSDWNWIMEVLKQITKNGYNWELIDFNGTVKEEKFMKCSLFNLKLTEPYYKFTFESSDEKEAVVKAINQFLMWYKQNK